MGVAFAGADLGVEAGLSHDEKKSSSSAAAAVAGSIDVAESLRPSTYILRGNLNRIKLAFGTSLNLEATHRSVSNFTLSRSSSLYFAAIAELYFFLVFASFNKAEPPFFSKNCFMAAFPPHFMLRSWRSVHESRFVLRTKEMCTPIFRCTLEQSKQM